MLSKCEHMMAGTVNSVLGCCWKLRQREYMISANE